MMMAVIDILRVMLATLLSMLVRRERLPQRAWSSEFTFRLAKQLLQESMQHEPAWMRLRQNLLSLYDQDYFRVLRRQETIAGVPCTVIDAKAETATDKVIVYLHGGGYVLGSAQSYTLTMAKLALKCQAQVIGVDYRLAPDTALPGAQEDCLAVIEALIDQHADKKLILMGDSAGGALCLASIRGLANAQLHSALSACVLISPWLEPLDWRTLSSENQGSDMLGKEITEHWRAYFHYSDEQALYLCHSDIETGILPPLYIQAAGAEVFIGQIESLVKRLEEEVSEEQVFEYKCFPGQFHVFQTLAPLVREADAALQDIADFVARLES